MRNVDKRLMFNKQVDNRSFIVQNKKRRRQFQNSKCRQIRKRFYAWNNQERIQELYWGGGGRIPRPNCTPPPPPSENAMSITHIWRKWLWGGGSMSPFSLLFLRTWQWRTHGRNNTMNISVLSIKFRNVKKVRMRRGVNFQINTNRLRTPHYKV